jgi:hypothetical protein
LKMESRHRPHGAIVQRFALACSLFLPSPRHHLIPQVCRNPGCGRWGVRAREVRRRFDEGLPALGAPPSLPRCQGVAGASCHTRYCSRYCQAMHWPKHRAECGPAMLAHGDF